MYSRSYGSIETERKTDGISIPANYNGSLYTSAPAPRENQKKSEQTPREALPSAPAPEEPPRERTAGTLGSLLEKFTAEDIILFVLVFSLLREEPEEPGAILAVILALLLL